MSLALILALGGSAAAGVPTDAGEQHCPMSGVADCCRKARSQSKTTEARAARLCCSLNCSMPCATVPTGSVVNLLPGASALHGGALPSSASAGHTGLRRTYSPPDHNQHSPPAYILHLALLI
jgi:hypothetical protein